MKGVDISEKKRDIAKLLYTACGKAIRKYNYDFDDLYQEVCLGLLIRNKGEGAFDPERSSFGHYIIMVCNSVFRNFHAREQKRKIREPVGVISKTGEPIDAKEIAVDVSVETVSEESDIDRYLDMLIEKLDDQRMAWEIRTNKEKYKNILAGIFMGYSKGAVAKDVGISRIKMFKMLKKYRDKNEFEHEIIESPDDDSIINLIQY